MNRVYFVGDSAGAQIASQFVNIQVEKDYADIVGIEGTVRPGIIEVKAIQGEGRVKWH